MNPNSNYYLSFNVGYPNAYDRAWDRTGGNIMVHGVCSSAGCFSMTDAQIAEIYAIVREAFNGGQREIQMQSYPFTMTAENLAKHRLDPNIDVLEAAEERLRSFRGDEDRADGRRLRQALRVRRPCRRRGVRAARLARRCKSDDEVETAVAAKEAQDDAAVAALVAKGVKPIRLVYADGGQNPVFAGKSEPQRSRCAGRGAARNRARQYRQALARRGRGRERGDAAPRAGPTRAPAPNTVVVASAAPAIPAAGAYSAQAPASSTSPLGFVGGVADGGKSIVKNIFKVGGDTAPAIQVFEPAEPIPADVPLPPRRAASIDAPVRVASLPSAAIAKPKSDAVDAAMGQ